MMHTQQQLISALSHVLWIGGSPCAGKTSITDRLAQTYSLQAYHFDRTEMERIDRRIARGDSALAGFLSQSMDQRWLLRSPEVMAQSVIGFWTERFRRY
jgi:adenylate kinase family enzyme